jgi:hypothetical protein
VKTYKVTGTNLHVLLTLPQDGDKRLTLRCGSFIPEEFPVVAKEGVGWTEEVAKRKIFVPAWNLTSTLQNECLLIATVLIIHTIPICGEMRIPTPLLKATFNNVSVSMCGVQFWMTKT